ncbi:hypothetical protein [Streptomyces hyaluromycini]|nr:hypothetical protein [Streptomyces hyaluromycini]
MGDQAGQHLGVADGQGEPDDRARAAAEHQGASAGETLDDRTW